MWPRFVDAHLHLHDTCFMGKQNLVIMKAEASGICGLLCNATREEDWKIIMDLQKDHFWIIPFLGIHPWFTESVKPGWETRLHDLLSAKNKSCGIGEIGLDKVHPADFSVQVKLFESQLDIAYSLKMPASIHCVRAWGKTIEILEKRAAENRLPSIMIHSFDGSYEMMRRFANIGCFLSYSAKFADASQVKLQNTLKQTPIDLLLLESDAPYQCSLPLAQQEDMVTEYNEPVVVTSIYRLAAHVKGVHLDDFAARLWQNASIFTYNALGR